MRISGAVLPYGRDASEKVLKLLRNVAKRTDKEQRKLAELVLIAMSIIRRLSTLSPRLRFCALRLLACAAITQQNPPWGHVCLIITSTCDFLPSVPLGVGAHTSRVLGPDPAKVEAPLAG
jgi:hypothetical protein